MGHLEKQNKTLKTIKSPTPINGFSSNFHQNHRTLPGHLTLDTNYLDNLGQGQHLHKKTHLGNAANISKQTSNVKSR